MTRIHEISTAGDSCELAMGRQCVIEFRHTEGDPDRLKEILAEEGKKSAIVLGPTISDLQRKTDYDLSLLDVEVLYSRLYPGVECDESKYYNILWRITNTVESMLCKAAWESCEDQPYPLRGCGFRRRNSSFSLWHRKVVSFNNVEGFRNGADWAMKAIADLAGRVAQVLEGKLNDGSFLSEIQPAST